MDAQFGPDPAAQPPQPQPPYAGPPSPPYPGAGWLPPDAGPGGAGAPRRSRRAAIRTAGVGVLAVAATVAGVTLAVADGATVAGTGSIAGTTMPHRAPAGPGDQQGGQVPGGPQQDGRRQATAAQQVGVVDINTVLGYQGAAAAGTGMVLTASGAVLTNNHVVRGATSIRVTVVSTGATYRATVVGTDPSEDVAVIQLANASGLQPAHFGDSASVAVGEPVTGVGNAGGLGGTPHAATGTVLALNQTITASDDGSGDNAETLHGLIETDAPIRSGDSGGPLYDSDGTVVGMDTAASTSGRMSADAVGRTQTASTAYAIPIDTALGIAGRIDAGRASATVHLGYPAFLGVSVVPGTGGGAMVASALPGTPAAAVGIGSGDVITSVGGTRVSDSTALQHVLAGHRPGDRTTVGWLDAGGQAHQATVTLAAGPAD